MDSIESGDSGIKPGHGRIDLFGYLDRVSAGGGLKVEGRGKASWGPLSDTTFFGEGWVDRDWNGRVGGGVLAGARWRW